MKTLTTSVHLGYMQILSDSETLVPNIKGDNITFTLTRKKWLWILKYLCVFYDIDISLMFNFWHEIPIKKYIAPIRNLYKQNIYFYNIQAHYFSVFYTFASL